MRKLIGFLIVLFMITACHKDPCKNTNCQNGGTCIEGNCQCPDGFTGANCETEVICKLKSLDMIFGSNPKGDLYDIEYDDQKRVSKVVDYEESQFSTYSYSSSKIEERIYTNNGNLSSKSIHYLGSNQLVEKTITESYPINSGITSKDTTYYQYKNQQMINENSVKWSSNQGNPSHIDRQITYYTYSVGNLIRKENVYYGNGGGNPSSYITEYSYYTDKPYSALMSVFQKDNFEAIPYGTFHSQLIKQIRNGNDEVINISYEWDKQNISKIIYEVTGTNGYYYEFPCEWMCW